LVFNITIVYQNSLYPEENGFRLLRSESRQVYSQISYGDLTGPATFSVDLPVGDYHFELFDSYGDGFQLSGNPGAYVDLLVDGEVIFHVDEEFSDYTVFSFQVPLPLIQPATAPPTSLVFNITIVYENYEFPEEHAFILKGSESGQVYSQVLTGEITDPGSLSVELEVGGYDFELFDEYGDGFSNYAGTYTGGYVDLLVDGEVIFHVDEDFLAYVTFSFQVPFASSQPATLMPSSSPTATLSPSTTVPPTSFFFNITIVYQVSEAESPEDNEFSLTRSGSGQVYIEVAQGELTGPAIYSVEVGPGGYEFDLFDSWFNGFRNEYWEYAGGYLDIIVDGEVIFHAGSDFFGSESFSFQVPLVPATEMPSSSPTEMLSSSPTFTLSPSSSPTVTLSPSSTARPTALLFNITIVYQNSFYPEENSFNLDRIGSVDGSVEQVYIAVAEGELTGSAIYSVEVGPGRYMFQVFDSYEDGFLDAQGNYAGGYVDVLVEGESILRVEGWFSDYFTFVFWVPINF